LIQAKHLNGTKTMDNKHFANHVCVSDYLMDRESSLTNWRALFRMASMGFAEVVWEDGEIAIWATEEKIVAFNELDIDEIEGD
jgi:hypothetical protein